MLTSLQRLKKKLEKEKTPAKDEQKKPEIGKPAENEQKEPTDAPSDTAKTNTDSPGEQKSESKPNDGPTTKWACNKCDHGFDKPGENGGCPKCFSKDIMETLK